MTTNVISVRVDEEKASLLDFLSTELDRSKNYIVNQAIDRYFEDEAHHTKQLLESIKEADEGQLIEHEKVIKDLDKKISSHQS